MIASGDEHQDVAPVEAPGVIAGRPRLSGEATTVVAALIPFACALAIARFGFEGRALVVAMTAGVLLVLAAIDLEHRILPNRIVLPAIGVVLVAQILFFSDRAAEWILAGIASAVFIAAPRLIRRDAMGMGDVKLAALLGVALGWSVFSAIIVGCLAIVPVAGWMLFRDTPIKGATLPFGPFLAFGTLVMLFTS